MPSFPETKNESSLTLALSLVILGGLACGFATQIPLSLLGNNQDPGNRFLPYLTGGWVLLSGFWELWRVLSHRKQSSTLQAPLQWKVMSGFALGSTLYLMAWSWLGFVTSTTIACLLAGKYQKMSLKSNLILTLCLTLLIYFLFSRIFQVPLPKGWLI